MPDERLNFRPFESAGGVIRDLTDAEWADRDAKVERERAEEEARCEQQRQDELRRNLVEHGCPAKDLERAISGDMRATQALTETKGAVALGLPLLVLSGKSGCGKTTAAAWWLVQRHPPTKYVRTREARFVDSTALARWPKYEDAKMGELERASALVIDDLGVEYDDKGGAFRSFLDGLVNARYAACLPTLITTNLPGKVFRERYGERIADRIREAGRYVELGGESLRKRNALRERE